MCRAVGVGSAMSGRRERWCSFPRWCKDRVPPTSILPGIDRFAGIGGGLLILLMVSLLTAPNSRD